MQIKSIKETCYVENFIKKFTLVIICFWYDGFWSSMGKESFASQ